MRDEKAGGFALYRLGSEDPAIWDALNVPRDFNFDDQTRQALELIKSTDTITDVGDGEIVTVDEDRTDGMRNLAVDADGYLTAKYVKFPEFPTLYHQGAGGEHQVAITFDDGPDPRWTPKILDILKAANVKAAFFLVGVNAEHYPGLVRRIVDEGHEIGNHTYYHPNLALCWPEHIRLGAERHAAVARNHHRPRDDAVSPALRRRHRPDRLSELTPLKIAEDLNYLVVLGEYRSARLGEARGRHYPATNQATTPRWQHHSAARCGRRSLANRRSASAHSGLAAYARRHRCAVEHIAGNDARRS